MNKKNLLVIEISADISNLSVIEATQLACNLQSLLKPFLQEHGLTYRGDSLQYSMPSYEDYSDSPANPWTNRG